MSDLIAVRALLTCSPRLEMAEGEVFTVAPERALNLAEVGWATPVDEPDWWPEGLTDRAHEEARRSVAARARQTAVALRRSRSADDVVSDAEAELQAVWGARQADRRRAAALAAYPVPKKDPWRPPNERSEAHA